MASARAAAWALLLVCLWHAASAQYFGNATGTIVCTHDNPDCRPVTSSELGAVVSVMTVIPWIGLCAAAAFFTFAG
ncbi:hypothetical protein FNF27_06612 [Cafeteria roenbergensis]|uniref:Uncharacterized protein n=1 Tax=Cafeteria roenbergensis TaxID=33653 RepID=A0A5A8DS52_CAFRO|nr:hypothetical protein FNF29_03723 [Cafeteria roenbergensis]KAA0165694.1 hypothetical protein FNF31_01671 [Cafeteria roenbergensis]KAA0166670.1 hypothetical protein FNF28_03044 [Cafeteria roenbergensis]KAA0170355.1 hypothetical protein FNF27_06612 [Cafeteria roenbergensis]|eukprot:KAA0152836.1 hypothetical protein FNF29_03723 [Cafeteria roenbergensis]